VNDGKFGNRVEAYKDLQACSHAELDCLDKWDQGLNSPYSHVYIYNSTDPMRFPLTIHLKQDDNYELVFQNDQTMVFEKAR
jgi:hypothetical protein